MKLATRIPLLALALAGTAGAAGAQMVPGGAGSPDSSIFAPLNLWPSPSLVRAGSGAPGSRYWQNRADYDLTATIDTAARTVHGTMRLHYTNNSPDTLTFIWVQTEQNAFKSNSLNSFVYPQDSRFGARGFEGGDVIERFTQTTARGEVPLKLRANETVTKVDLAEPLAPGHSVTLSAAWHFLVPEHGADRMGRDGALYEIAQWYPRVNVYDDAHGWNTEPYLGQGEFYLEYGDFTYSVTVPAGYIVAGTGMVANPAEVLTPTQIARLDQAKRSATPVHIITAAELQSGAARPRKTGTLTWRFTAQNVRDVAFAASPDYLWDASSYDGILAMGFYRAQAADNWFDAADQSRMSIQEYSERWFRYPWPQITAVEGPISGMEYPMLAMENHSEDVYDLYNVVTHEIGHDWFPMIVGSNERVHMWQDEGLNEFINSFSEARRYPQKGSQEARARFSMDLLENAQKAGNDVTSETPPDRVPPARLGLSQYFKPTAALQILRREVLGPDAFDDAFRTYVRRWAFKHPTPADFFRTMEDVSGRRLDWFWREFFLENPKFDQAVGSVGTATDGSVTVTYVNHARGVLPIRARFTFADGTTQDFNYPAEVWSTNTASYERSYQFGAKRLTRIELDPDKRLIDIDRTNNVWTAAAR